MSLTPAKVWLLREPLHGKLTQALHENPLECQWVAGRAQGPLQTGGEIGIIQRKELLFPRTRIEVVV